MSITAEQPAKQRRKRDWLDWGQGIVTLLTALLAVWINFQQQMLKGQQDNIDLTLKKESATTLFTDKIVQQLNTLSEQDSKIIKGTIILELMGLDIQAHLIAKTGQEDQLKKLEEDCKQIPSRIALFTANTDALDVSEETKWVEYAYNTDNRIARHTALRALGLKALQPPERYSSGDSRQAISASQDQGTVPLLQKRLDDILSLSDNLESPDLAIDALDAISSLAERYQNISSDLRGTETFGRILRGMVDLQRRLKNGQNGNRTPESRHQLNEQLTALNSTWKCLIDTKFLDKGQQLLAAVSSTAQ